MRDLLSFITPEVLAEAAVAVVTVAFISFASGLLSGMADILIDLLRRKLKLDKNDQKEKSNDV